METIRLNKDITLFYIKAASFPAGVMEAWDKLHSLLPSSDGRNFYGISHGDKNGGIVYMAAVEETYAGEAEKVGCTLFIVPQGQYIEEKLANWKKDETSIGRTFQKLLTDPRIDAKGFCLENYLNDGSVKCLVKINSAQQSSN